MRTRHDRSTERDGRVARRLLVAAALLAALILGVPVALADGSTPVDTTTTETTVTTDTATTETGATTVITTTTTTPSTAPCVGAAAVAVFPPNAAPVLPASSVAAATSTGTTASSFAFPDDASIASAATVRAGGAGCRSGSAPGGASVVLRDVRLLGGAVTAAAVRTDLVPATTASGGGWQIRTTVRGLLVNGRGVRLDRTSAIAVGDTARVGVPARAEAPGEALPYWAGAFAVVLRRAAAGYPAGTVILVGAVGADVPGAEPAAPAKKKPAPQPKRRAAVAKKIVRKHKVRARKHVSRPLKVTPPLVGGPYVFPVLGQVEFGDTYGADRSDVSGGWHHGDDIFAPLGVPILAVANGTVYTVGWNEVGGWRLWLRDRQGNRFYYAHLSGYTQLAKNGAHVKAGTVLAFVGNTGDAFTTPTHLHFEVHPVSLLRLHYDGAVDPTKYLDAWRHLAHIHVPRPAALPAGASTHGQGAVTDYRRLLAVRGLTKHHRPSLLPEQKPPPVIAVPSAVRRRAVGQVGRVDARAGGLPIPAWALALAVLVATASSALAVPAVRRRLPLSSRAEEEA